jgi:hypothetical protein
LTENSRNTFAIKSSVAIAVYTDIFRQVQSTRRYLLLPSLFQVYTSITNQLQETAPLFKASTGIAIYTGINFLPASSINYLQTPKFNVRRILTSRATPI